jgi:hypothetical protein
MSSTRPQEPRLHLHLLLTWFGGHYQLEGLLGSGEVFHLSLAHTNATEAVVEIVKWTFSRVGLWGEGEGRS